MQHILYRFFLHRCPEGVVHNKNQRLKLKECKEKNMNELAWKLKYRAVAMLQEPCRLLLIWTQFLRLQKYVLEIFNPHSH